MTLPTGPEGKPMSADSFNPLTEEEVTATPELTAPEPLSSPPATRQRRSAKYRTAERRAGELALYGVQEAERMLWDYRARMHRQSATPARRLLTWMHIYAGARLAVVELRAARILYDRLPQRAK